MMLVDVVVPTMGRPSLALLLHGLGHGQGPRPRAVLVVDDRTDATAPLPLGDVPPALAGRVRVLRGRAAGPAAARNVGWRAAATPWVAFLDDDVLPPPGWGKRLEDDLRSLPAGVGGCQGRIRVPVPADRRATDWERNVQGLEQARWATADMAYRRHVLAAVGGFDERFPRAYREDADLALRVRQAGWSLTTGARWVTHPVRPADRWISVRLQAGNADDVLMRALHGPRWRQAAGIPRGRRRRHLAITAAAALAVTGAATRSRRMAAIGAAGWIAGTLELAWARIAPGPGTGDEVATMLRTSAVLPIAATAHWLRGLAARGRLRADTARAPRPRPADPPAAVLFDRDGTLVVDVPHNADPARVQPVAEAAAALRRLRAAGVAVAVVSNQSGVARGLLTRQHVDAVNREIERQLGPLGPWLVCLHGPDDGCICRKPAPGLVLSAAAALGVDPTRCAVVGDTGADVAAARAAGARAVLVPNRSTRVEEILTAPEVAPDLGSAVELLLGDGRTRTEIRP